MRYLYPSEGKVRPVHEKRRCNSSSVTKFTSVGRPEEPRVCTEVGYAISQSPAENHGPILTDLPIA
jgi:hypothetical protein